MARNIKHQTVRCIRDLHAREMMRLGCYRQHAGGERISNLRERKARHTAFLLELLRKRGIAPAWYARLFYYIGHLFGWCTALLPAVWARRIERTLEFWMLIRYERYFHALRLTGNLRSMIEAMQMTRLSHNEPGEDVLALIRGFANNQRIWLENFTTTESTLKY